MGRLKAGAQDVVGAELGVEAVEGLEGCESVRRRRDVLSILIVRLTD